LILTSKVSSTLLSQVPPCLTFFRFFFHCPFILLIVSTLESQIAEADEAAAVTKRNVADKIRGMGALADSVKKLEGEVALGQRQKEELERQLSETGNSLRMLQTLPTTDLPQVPSLCLLVSVRFSNADFAGCGRIQGPVVAIPRGNQDQGTQNFEAQ